MNMRYLIAISALLGALAACNGAAIPADPTREEVLVYAAESHWLAAAHTHGFERALRTAAQE